MNKNLRIFLSLAIPLLFAFVLYKYSSLSYLKVIMKNLNPNNLLISVTVYFLTYMVRALRFKVFMPHISTNDMSFVICIHTFFNNIMPFRSGEVSFPIILKNIFNVNISSSTTTLIIVRFMDLISISLIFFLSAIFVVENKGILIISTTITAILLSLLLVLYRMLKLLTKKFDFFKPLKEAIEYEINVGFRKIAVAYMYSMCLWLLKFLSFFFILRAGGIEISLLKTIVVSTFGELTTVLPIHSIGGYGTYEAGLIGGFSLIKTPVKHALAISFYFHTAILIMSSFLAIIGWIYFLTKKNLLDKDG